MSLRPLGHRILVKPDAQPERSGSGLILPQDHDHIPSSGTVVALGEGGPQGKYRARQRALQMALDVIVECEETFNFPASLQVCRENVARLLGSADPQREIQVGDRVAYAVEVGLKLVEDGTEYIILNEDDVAVLVADEQEAAA